MKTRSIRYLEEGGLEIVEIDVPDPGPGEVQVKAAACGICKWDVNTYKNRTHKDGVPDPWAAPPGHEGVGYICKVGPGIEGLNEGDRVANGSFAGYANFPAGNISLIPSSDLPDEHWIVEPPSCVLTGLDTAKLLAGDRVAVIGCGYMGLMFIQALEHFYADRVIAIDIDEEKPTLAEELGATQTLNLAADDSDDALTEWTVLKRP